MRQLDYTILEQTCRYVRSDIVRMIHKAGSGHPGGSLSSVELLTGLYFSGIFRVNVNNPDWEDRDRFILSKGHCAPLIYSVLARKGFFPYEDLWTLRKLGSPLQGHPHKGSTVGLDCSAGSLGQGLSISNGLGISFKKQGKDCRVYCLLGDGELQEGQVWEAMMTAAQHHLDNVCAMVDYNHVQLDGRVEDIKALGDLCAKWRDFGWNVIEIDGHNIRSVVHAYELAALTKGKPTVIIANTIKGKGVSFMEGSADWHGKAPNDEQLAQALKEIGYSEEEDTIFSFDRNPDTEERPEEPGDRPESLTPEDLREDIFGKEDDYGD